MHLNTNNNDNNNNNKSNFLNYAESFMSQIDIFLNFMVIQIRKPEDEGALIWE